MSWGADSQLISCLKLARITDQAVSLLDSVIEITEKCYPRLQIRLRSFWQSAMAGIDDIDPHMYELAKHSYILLGSSLNCECGVRLQRLSAVEDLGKKLWLILGAIADCLENPSVVCTHVTGARVFLGQALAARTLRRLPNTQCWP